MRIDQLPNIVERSYQLAKTGAYEGILDVRRRLAVEGYNQNAVAAHFSGLQLKRAIIEHCRQAQGKPRRPPPGGTRKATLGSGEAL
jgi:hypothetical protein